MFPGAGAVVYRNEAGEPLGWDYPSDDYPEYCDQCGGHHGGSCNDEYDEPDNWCRKCGEEHDSIACPNDDDLERSDESIGCD